MKHRLFIPGARPLSSPLAPLVVALHGCTQTASDFAAGTRFDSVAQPVGAYVLYPEQSVAANPNRCWNWFLPDHQCRESGEPAEILSLVNEIVGRHPIDRERIFVTGLSAGGAMAAILAEVAPDVFAAVGIMAGVALHSARDVASAFAAMHGDAIAAVRDRIAATTPATDGRYDRLRISIWGGARDRLVVPQNASLLTEQFLHLVGVDPSVAQHERHEDSEIVRYRDRTGRVRVETRRVESLGHAWSGGSFRGSHTFPKGPRASDDFLAFFLDASEIARVESVATALEPSESSRSGTG